MLTRMRGMDGQPENMMPPAMAANLKKIIIYTVLGRLLLFYLLGGVQQIAAVPWSVQIAPHGSARL